MVKTTICLCLALWSGTLVALDDPDSLLSDSMQQLLALTPEAQKKEYPYSTWGNAVGLYATQAPLAGTSAFRYSSTGGFVGLDYIGFENIWFGGSVGYLYTMLQQSANAGHQHIQNIYLSTYVYVVLSKFAIDVAVTPAYLYTTNHRNVVEPSFTGVALGRFPTYEITPHVGVNYTWDYQWGAVSPFARCDWTVNWNGGFTEINAQAFNIQQPGSMNSLLQAEAGLNLYEYLNLGERGVFYFRQKGGYLSRVPFVPSTSSGVYVESSTNFVVGIGSAVQHMFTAAAEILYKRGNSSGFVNYDLQYGTGFLMQMVTLSFRHNF